MELGERITNVGTLFELPDEMTTDQVRDRLCELVRRDDVLRVTELSFADGGYATYSDAVDLPFSIQRAGSPEEVREITSQMSFRTFELGEGRPLWEAAVISHPGPSGRPTRSMCASFAHLISDARSLLVFRDGLTGAADLAPRPFRDWVTIQREMFPMTANGTQTAAGEFWRRYLDGTPPDRGTVLPFWRPGQLSGTSFLIHTELPVTKAMLRAGAGQRRSSPFLLFLAAVTAAIGDAASVNDITYRVNINGRIPDFIDTLGLFSDIGPVRVNGSSLSDPAAALEAATSGWLESLEFQTTPWEYVLEVCPPAAPPATGYPAPQVLLNFIPEDVGEIPPDCAEEGPFPGDVEAFQLAAILRDEGNCLLDCEFDPERFPKAGVYDFLGALGETLTHLVTR